MPHVKLPAAAAKRRRTFLLRAAAVVAALALWQIVALILQQKLLLPSPLDVVLRLGGLLREPEFFARVWYSFSRIVGGCLLAIAAGTLLALLAGRFRAVEIFLWPYMLTVKTVPVASFIILAFVWLTSAGLSVFISFLMVLPVVYTNVLGGIRGMDRNLGEMAEVFRMSTARRVGYVWIPQLKTPFLSAVSLAVGMAWKAGVAAEVIGVPQGSLGEQLYYAKVYFETVDLFAWTVVILLCSVLFEKAFLALLSLAFRLFETRACPRPSRVPGEPPAPAGITADGVGKSYGEKTALAPVSFSFAPGGVYAVMGRSGAGKTTLFRLLAGLETPSCGSLSSAGRVSLVFQEDRLPECFSAVVAVMMASPSVTREAAGVLLAELGLGGACEKPVRELSGGMKRRVAIARALLSPSDLLLLDEPFKGLDGETRRAVVASVLRHRAGRTLVAVTHDAEEAALLGAAVLSVGD